MRKIITKRTFVFLIFFLISSLARAVTLQDVVLDVLKRHPRVLAAKAGEMADQYSLRQAQGGYMPKLLLKVARGTEVSGNSVVRTAIRTRSVQFNRQEHSLSFNQMIFDGFRARSNVNQQQYILKSDRYNISAEEQSLIQEVAEAYLNVIRARELIILARNNIKTHKRTLENIRLRFRGGAGTRGEIQLAESRLALATVGLGGAMGRLQSANASYFALVARQAPLIMRKPPSLRRYMPRTKSRAVKMAMQFNPDINMSKARMASSNEAIHEARSNMFPRLNLEVNATDNQNLDGVPGRNFDFSAMLVMNYTIYNGGEDLAVLNKARTIRLQNLHNVNSARREVLRRVTRSWADWNENLNVYGYYRTYVNKQRGVVKDYKQQFSLGKRALFNVLDAENELFRARVGLTESYYNARIDTYKVLARIGILSPSII